MRIAKEGWDYIAALSVLGIGALAFPPTRIVAVIFFGAAAFVVFFFRDPNRTIPGGDNLVVSPADGEVVYVGAGERDPSRSQISIFLSLLDVHINRSPIGGVVRKVRYTPGQFLSARLPDAGAKNEQNELELADGDFEVTVRQIAGVLARRIVCNVEPDQALKRGERFGLIQFGSRLEVILPAATALRVKVGDRVRGGETVIAERP